MDWKKYGTETRDCVVGEAGRRSRSASGAAGTLLQGWGWKRRPVLQKKDGLGEDWRVAAGRAGKEVTEQDILNLI